MYVCVKYEFVCPLVYAVCVHATCTFVCVWRGISMCMYAGFSLRQVIKESTVVFCLYGSIQCETKV